MSEAALTLDEAARLAGGRVAGDGGAVFKRIAPVRDAGEGDLAFLADRRYVQDLAGCRGRALLVAEALAAVEQGPRDRLVVGDPYRALGELLRVLRPDAEVRAEAGVHATAVVASSASVDPSAQVGPGAVVGERAAIGERVVVGANCVVGEAAAIGADTVLFPNATVYPGCVLGARVIVHAGTRIGVDGFGYATVDGWHVKVPQVGGCVVEDDVEIGANCTIDRGSIGRTVIGAGSKLDNLVHVAHNVVIGPRSLLVAQVGVAGSTRTGPGVAMGGQAGLVGHLEIGAGARIGAQAGVVGDVGPGETVSGYPARDHKSYLRAMARLMRLPELAKRVARLERALDRASGRTGSARQAGQGDRRAGRADDRTGGA